MKTYIPVCIKKYKNGTIEHVSELYMWISSYCKAMDYLGVLYRRRGECIGAYLHVLENGQAPAHIVVLPSLIKDHCPFRRYAGWPRKCTGCKRMCEEYEIVKSSYFA